MTPAEIARRLSEAEHAAPDVAAIARGLVDAQRRCSVIPVIHYADDDQAMRNADRALEAGCDGVMLIEMRGRDHFLPPVARAIKDRWPSRLVGLNFLNALTCWEMPFSIAPGMDMSWTDMQLTHSADDQQVEARMVRRCISDLPGHMLFCGVAFKYQVHEPDPVFAARRAIEMGFIPTTSGPSTGASANPSAIKQIREALGSAAPLAIASGITPDNAAEFLPHVSHVLISTGISASFHEFDPARLRALMQVRAHLAALKEQADG